VYGIYAVEVGLSLVLAVRVAGELPKRNNTTFKTRRKFEIKERSTLQTIKRRKANWNDHILRRNYVLKHVIYGKIEGRIDVTGRRGR
jgi:hypothetical protein